MVSSRTQRNRVWIVAVGVAAIALVAIFIWRQPAPQEGAAPKGRPEQAGAEIESPKAPVAQPRIPREEALQLVEQRNLSLGYLENENLAACDPLLVEIAKSLPRDPFGPRNLAVARLLALLQTSEAVDAAAHQAAKRAALDAVEMLEQVEGETAILHVLRSRIERSASPDGPQSFSDLERAAELAPEQAWVSYELYQAARFANDNAVRERARGALHHAVELQSDNVWLLIELLPLQAEQVDAAVGVNLKRLMEIVTPFSATIAAQMRINPSELLEQAQQAVMAGDWATVLQRVRVVSNVLRPDALAQADKRRVDRHPLAFVLPDFGATFAERADLPGSQPTDAIPVSFGGTDGAPISGMSELSDLALADFDLDGRFDMLALAGDRIAVIGRGDADDWAAVAETAVPAGYGHLLIADLDDDVDANAAAPLNQSEETICRHADVDAVVWGASGLAVLENRLDGESGARSLELVEQDAGWQAIGNARAAELADVDHDGDLDLLVLSETGVSLWSNRGNLTFENISERSALPDDANGFSGLLPVDWDRDLDCDVLLIGDGRLGMLENLRHGRLRYRELEADSVPSGVQAWGLADIDNDQSWDVISAGEQGLAVQQTDVGVDGDFTLKPPVVVSSAPCSDFDALDYDNDGTLDLLAWSGAWASLYRGTGARLFAEATEMSGQIPQQASTFAVGDVDEDGDLDLIATDAAGIRFVMNDGGNANRWIDIAARAQQIKGNQSAASGRINHLGIGSTLVLRAANQDQTRLVRSEITHFGLGQQEQPDVVRILWTNGVPQNIIRPPANGEVCELQTLKGSCPYLYTWTGERFEFCTDLLWASPLGLQFAEGVVAPWRAWEYLKISGDRLVAEDGRYRLQVTEELWEAAYFDQVRLIAVDHPADIDVFTNEKVGPAEIAEHRIHTVRQRRIPVAALDQLGRDVLSVVAAEDGNFLKGWDHKVRQGLTEPHALELDLGRLDGAQRITLFLTGWVYPSDTSINVALSQNPSIESPRPPYIETPDADGTWREALPYMGFPGGKTKTIAVDVSNVFAGGDYRLRIGTTMEVCWDAVWFTVDEPAGEFRETELDLLSADLHFRGISRHAWGPNNGPQSYDYEDVEAHVPWPPMDGAFTRYGDVSPLLTAWDDRMIVMGAGDELTLEFAEPAELPAGWVRDFVIHNVGWDKDADLNTVYGQTSEPLPFRAMTVYALQDGEERSIDPKYAEYLRTYQTRRQNQSRFWTKLPGLSSQ